MPEHSGLISTIIRPDAGFHTVMWMDFLMPSIGIETEQADSALPYGGRRNSWLPAIKDIDLRHDNELQRMLARLDQPSRLRFAHPASNMPGHPSRMIGIYVEHTLLGALGLYNCGRPGHTDVALVVDEQWRCRGLGWALLTAAMHRAADAQASNLRVTFSRRNWPMRQLVRKANAKLDLLMGEICAYIAVAPADHKGPVITL